MVRRCLWVDRRPLARRQSHYVGPRAFDRISKGLGHGTQMIISESHAREEPLQLNGIRFRFLIPPHHQDFKYAEIILANSRQDREFDDIVRRD